MPTKSNTTDFIEKSIKKFGLYLNYSLVNYTSSRELVTLLCPIHGEFKQTPNLHLSSKYPCPKCGQGICSNDEFIKKSLIRHGNKFDYSLCNYTFSKNKLKIICNNHGEFTTTPAQHLKSESGGCKLCDPHLKLNTLKFIERAKNIHGDKYNYSESIYINNHIKVKIICPNHGVFEQSPSNHYKYGCLKCSGKYLKDEQEFILSANLIHKGKYDYSEVKYLGAHKNVKIKCELHGVWEQTPSNHLHSGGRGCPKCSNRISKNEEKWLNEIGLPNDKHHRNVYLNINSKKYFVDGFDPITKTVYEFNGDYWHGNLKVFDALDINKSAKKTFGELWERTLSKKNDLINAGYNVVSIWESEYCLKQKEKCQIIVENKYSTIFYLSDENINSLKKVLSYKINGAEFTQAYKHGWDGICYLLNKDGSFYTGLLNIVTDFLKTNKIEYSIIDKRAKFEFNSLDITDKLKKLNLVPREHQTKILEAIKNNDRGIIRACTGSGKSLCMALATAYFNETTIIYVIGLDLLKQFHDLFSLIFDEEIGLIGDGVCNIKRINIASLWTIGKALNISDIANDDLISNKEKDISGTQKNEILKLLTKTKIHCFDESHIITTSTAIKIYNTIDFTRIYGFSGTPFRDDNTELLINGILGNKIIDIGASELIEKNVLVQPLIKFVAVPPVNLKNLNYQEVYKKYITQNDERNNLIIKCLKDLFDKNYKVLVLFKQINHGNHLFTLAQKNGIKCALLNGNDKTKDREETKKKILSGEINVILASTIFDIGIDLPILNGLILCGSGKSSIRTLQRIGRIIRANPGKQFAAVIDFYDQVKFLKEHSKLRYNIYTSESGFKVIPCKEMKIK